MNPFSDFGIGYCIYEVSVNGQISEDEINSSAFEIDLSRYNFDIGEKINLILRYKEGCLPKIINPEVIQARASFELQNAGVDTKGILHWSTRNEMGPLTFVVQQYRWNKWITVGEVEGKGLSTINKYQLKVRLHTGKNIFRFYQMDYTGDLKYSDRISHDAKLPKVSFSPDRVKDEIVFTSETLYEIYDNYGNVIYKGFGDKINVIDLQQGVYYINYDNTMDSFRKR